MRSLGRLAGGNNSEAFGINNVGQVVGASATFGFGRDHAFLYSEGTMQDLGTLGSNTSKANGISDGGYVVGESTTGGFGIPMLSSIQTALCRTLERLEEPQVGRMESTTTAR